MTSDWQYFVTEGPPTDVHLTASDPTPSAGQVVTLTARATKGADSGFIYTWNIGAATLVEGGTQSSATAKVKWPSSGTDTVSVGFKNGSYGTPTASLVIPVGPQANDESYSVDEDNPLVRLADNGVMANDTGADFVKLTTPPIKGTLTFGSDGAFTYQPNVNECGHTDGLANPRTDSFSYSVRGGGAVPKAATVFITVVCVNDVPTATDATYQAVEDEVLDSGIEGGLKQHAFDVEKPFRSDLPPRDRSGLGLGPGVQQRPIPVHSSTERLQRGVVHLHGLRRPGPERTRQGHDPDHVHARRTGGDPRTFGVTGDVLFVAPAGSLGGTHADDDPLTFNIVQPPRGTLVPSSNGSFTYTTLANDCSAPDPFTYTVSDGLLTSPPATVQLNITCVNDTPSATNATYAATEDIPLVQGAVGGLKAYTTDVELSPLTFTKVTGPAHGTVTVNGDGSFRFDPALNSCATETFTYKANDGTDDSNTATVTISMACENDVPKTGADLYLGIDGAKITISAPGLLSNDTDVEGNPLTVVAGTFNTPGGTLVLNANGSGTYTAKAGFSGDDAITYTAKDSLGASSTGTVTFRIQARTASHRHQGGHRQREGDRVGNPEAGGQRRTRPGRDPHVRRPGSAVLHGGHRSGRQGHVHGERSELPDRAGWSLRRRVLGHPAPRGIGVVVHGVRGADLLTPDRSVGERSSAGRSSGLTAGAGGRSRRRRARVRST